jgi:hypothetical protein
VFDDQADMTAVAAGVSRFLAVESCGQCTPCKRDGLAIFGLLDKVCQSDASKADLVKIRKLTSTVGERARCTLATQHEAVVGSVLEVFGNELEAHISGGAPAVEPTLVAELINVEGGEATWDERHRQKQPDWTYDATDSRQFPAERYGEHRREPDLPE